MAEINYFAVVVAAVAAFVGSFVWYLVLGKELAEVSPAFAQQQPVAWHYHCVRQAWATGRLSFWWMALWAMLWVMAPCRSAIRRNKSLKSLEWV